MGLALLHVQGGRPSVQPLCLIRATEEMVHLSSTRQRGRLLARRRGEVGSLSEEACGLLVRPESGGPLGAGDEGPTSALTELRRVRSVGIEAIRLDEVRRDDLSDLVLGDRRGKVLRSRQMLLAAVTLRERVVGDLADQVLQEPILAVLGRTRIGLQPEQLLAHEPREHRFELIPCEACDGTRAH